MYAGKQKNLMAFAEITHLDLDWKFWKTFEIQRYGVVIFNAYLILLLQVVIVL